MTPRQRRIHHKLALMAALLADAPRGGAGQEPRGHGALGRGEAPFPNGTFKGSEAGEPAACGKAGG